MTNTASPEGLRAPIKDFRDLEVWQQAVDLCEMTYRLTWTFPRQETYGLASQLQRASVSIPSNIAEGRTRGSVKEYAHFVSVARGSLAEVRTQLVLARRLDYAKGKEIEAIDELADTLARRLNALRNSLQLKIAQSPNTQNPKPKTSEGLRS